MVCLNFHTIGLVRMPSVAVIVIRARCVACVSVVNIELNFGIDADYVRFPVVVAAPTPISLLDLSVYMCFHPLYLFSITSLNLIR